MEAGGVREGWELGSEESVSMVFTAWGLELGEKIDRRRRRSGGLCLLTFKGPKGGGRCGGEKTWAGGGFKRKGWSAEVLVGGGER